MKEKIAVLEQSLIRQRAELVELNTRVRTGLTCGNDFVELAEFKDKIKVDRQTAITLEEACYHDVTLGRIEEFEAELKRRGAEWERDFERIKPAEDSSDNTAQELGLLKVQLSRLKK